MSRLAALLAGGRPAASQLVSERLLRRVLRCELEDGRQVFAKQHLFPVLRVRLRYALRGAPGRREALRLAAARERGVCVPELVAERSVRGLLGPRLSVLVTEALPALGLASHAERLAAVERLAGLGIEHPDLHPDNVLRLEGGELGFLDFQSVRLHAAPLTGPRLVRMRAKAAEAAWAELGAAELCALLEELTGAEAAEATLAALTGVHARQEASRRRHALRTSTRFLRERVGLGWRVRLRDEIWVPEGGEEAPEQWLGGGVRGRLLRRGELLRVTTRGTRLRELWLRAALGDGPEGATFLAYRREAPWPWAREHLYIRPHRTLGGDADVMACWETLRPTSS